MKTYKLLQALVIAGLLPFYPLELIASTTKPKSVAKLNFVFTNEVNARNKEIIKLYDDLSYEFLFFEFYNKKPRVKREKGTYSLKKQKLTLNNSSKIQQKEHSDRFIIKDSEGLFACNRFGKISKSNQPSYLFSKDKKYWQETYKDSVFGEITNDKKAIKKIIEKKPEYNPVKAMVTYSIESTNDNVTNTITDCKFLSKDSLKKIKVVFVVGPVEEDTKSFIEEQKRNANYLKKLGVQVIELYHPNAKWKDIVKASENANIMVYAGHGGVAVFFVTDQIVEGDVIQHDLKLNKNAIVIFNHACESAGSSAGDTKDIGQNEAFRRVGDYAKPFIESNVSVYYANNYNDCLIPFFTSFFEHKPIREIYYMQATKWNKIEAKKKYQYEPNYEISIASKNGTNEIRTLEWYQNGKLTRVEKFKDCKTYDIAYVGKPNYTVNDLFK